MVWKPRVTVAAVIARDDQLLMVEEQASDGGLVLNQPAGHLEPGESLTEAVVREVREETAWGFEPQALVGIYRWQRSTPEATFLRFCFAGIVADHASDQPLDPDIRRTLWTAPETLRRDPARLRSPLVLRAVEDYLAGRRYPLDLLRDVVDAG